MITVFLIGDSFMNNIYLLYTGIQFWKDRYYYEIEFLKICFPYILYSHFLTNNHTQGAIAT